MTEATLDRVLLSWPQHLAAVADNATPTSWMQIARTGSFVSSRYGKFPILPTDLSEMLSNFRDITPKAPTRLPVDYDHLSMDPKRPGDGIAAGWITELALRDEGTTLWARVEWTQEAARRIRAKEYLFVSPSFVKNHVHKNGKIIGTTLLAAAITNHPFLEEMEALALNADQLGHFALAEQSPVPKVPSMITDGMQMGQRVMIKPEHAPDPKHIGVAFEIAEVVGQGDDTFASLHAADGTTVKWFRASELMPSIVRPATPPPNTATTEVSMNMNAGDTALDTLARKLQRERGIDYGEALKEASRQRMDLAEAHREAIADAELGEAVGSAATTPADAGMQLSRKANEIAQQEHISLSAATVLASQRHPELVTAYNNQFNCGERLP